MKTCNTCKIEKEDEEFYSWCHTRCKSCIIAHKREYRRSDSGKASIIKYARSDKCKLQLNRYQHSDKGKIVSRRAMDKYQLTDKGKEATRRHKSSPKGRSTLDRYQKSDKGRESIRKYRESNALWIKIRSTLNRKRKRGYKIEVTVDELYDKFKDITHCYICGCELNRYYGNGTAFDNTISFDRIDNSNTITLNNMGVSCYACNVMKQHRSLNEYLVYLDKVSNNNFNIAKYNPELSLDHLIDKSYPITDIRRYYIRSWAKHILRTHKRNGCNVKITTNELLNLYVQTPNCPICGCKLEHGVGKLHNQSPSMDRINNTIDLKVDDVWVICHKCNTTKRTLTLKQFKEYADKVCKRFNYPSSPTTNPI